MDNPTRPAPSDPSAVTSVGIRRWVAGVLQIPSLLLVGAVRVYQWCISPWLGAHCRFSPTCSEYFVRAVQKYGALKGSAKGVWRICRCHPFHPGGHDPP